MGMLTDKIILISGGTRGAGDDWLEQAGASLPMGRLGQVDDVARLAVLLLSDASGVVTGSIIDWDQTAPGAHD